MMTNSETTPLFVGASRLGFGCASLGSRVGWRRGLAALEAAFVRGINWFDLAPSYGDGQCETIFGRFAKGRRNQIFICTKVGIAPGTVSPGAALIRPAARVAVRLLPPLTRLAARGRAKAESVPISGDEIRTSLDASLRRLQTDYVDVLALHDPQLSDLCKDDVARALQDVLSSGKARVVGIAGTFDAAVTAIKRELPVAHLQFAWFEADNALSPSRDDALAKIDGKLIVTHSVFTGVGLSKLDQMFATRARDISALLNQHGYDQPVIDALNAAKLDYCFAKNLSGIVLASMFRPMHLDFNVECMTAGRAPNAVALFRDIRKLA